jgi:glycosyltransferase involved in cell wall biosynthesis
MLGATLPAMRDERSGTPRPHVGKGLRVLFIVTAYPRHEGDVITPWMAEAIRQLSLRGVAVEVLAPSYKGGRDHSIDGVPVHRFRYAPRALEQLTHDQTAPDRVRERPAYLGVVPSYVVAGSLAAVRLARTGRFDVLHAFWPIPHGLLGLAARSASGVPLVCTFFGAELSWVGKDLPFLSPILRRIARSSDGVTTNSLHTARLLARYAGEDIAPAVVPFGAAVEATREIPAYRPDPSRPFEMLFVGRLVERKGVHRLLDAVARFPKARAARLHLVGDGPDRAALQARAEAHGLHDRVIFHGFVSEEEKRRRLASCDVLVLPAVIDAKGDTEGQGVVLLEAMTFGKPVAASRVGGIVEAVEDGVTGLLVPPDDPHALASALFAVMDDIPRARRMGVAGRFVVEQRFSWEAIAGSLESVYHRVRRVQRGS